MTCRLTYDDIINFDYLNKEVWKTYVKNYIVPILKIALYFRELEKILKEKFTENLKECFDNNEENLQRFLLGGVNEKGEFEGYSLAKLVNLIFGIDFTRKEYIYFKSIGEDPFEKENVRCVFEENEFMDFIKEIIKRIKPIIRSLKIDSPLISSQEINEIIKNPEKIVELLKDLYTNILKFHPSYNQQTFFIRNFHLAPYFYLLQAYPKLQSNFEQLAENILELEPKLTFPLQDDMEEKKFTLWGYKEHGLGNAIYSLLDLIEKKFHSSFYSIDDFILIEDPIDLKEDYLDLIESEVNRHSENFRKRNLSFPLSLIIDYDYDYNPKKKKFFIGKVKDVKPYYFVLLGTTITYINNHYSKNTKDRFREYRVNIDIRDFINIIAPYLFLDILDLFRVSEIREDYSLTSNERNNGIFYKFSVRE